MSLMAPFLNRAVRLRPADEVALFDATTEWHVGTHEAVVSARQQICRCAKAPCGAVIPRREVLCSLHHGGSGSYAFMHPATACTPARRRPRLRLRRRARA